MRRGVLTAAVLLLLATACAAQPARRPPQPPPQTRVPDCSSAPPRGRVLTPPGTTLCLGTAALLPVLDAEGRRAAVRVAVTSFAEVSEDELARFEATGADRDIDFEQTTVYTLTAQAELVAVPPTRRADGIEPLGLAGLVSEEDSAEINVLRRRNPRGCRARFFDVGHQPGDRLTSCAWFTVDRDDVVSAAEVGSDVAAYDPLDGAPLVWE